VRQVEAAMGAGLRPSAKALEPPPDPEAAAAGAAVGNGDRRRAEVSRGHSSHRTPRGRGAKARTSQDEEEPWVTRHTY